MLAMSLQTRPFRAITNNQQLRPGYKMADTRKRRLQQDESFFRA